MTFFLLDRIGAGRRKAPRRSWLGGVAHYAWRFWAAWETRQRLDRATAELMRMDDRMLRDIGLTRFELVRMKGRHRDSINPKP